MKKSEKRLLFTLVGLAFLGGLVIASSFYFDKRDELVVERQDLDSDWAIIQANLEVKELWEMRALWLEKNQPKFTSYEQMTQALFKESLAEGETGFTTSKHNPLPNDRTSEYMQAGVSFIAQGDLSSFMRWVYDLTRPDSFRVFKNLKLAPDKENEDKIIATNIELLRWYAPPDL